MARVDKYCRGSVGNLFAHYDRTKIVEECKIKFPELTETNYNLGPEGNQQERLYGVIGNKSKNIKGFAKCLNRKNVKVFCSWCVTMPKDLEAKYEETFFKHTYNFLEERYGVEGNNNIISAYVHRDEVTPHMHFVFVPLVKDSKGGCKVSAKECINRQELRRFHRDLQRYIEEKMGRIVNINNGVTKVNKSVKELREDANKALSEAEAMSQGWNELECRCKFKEPGLIEKLLNKNKEDLMTVEMSLSDFKLCRQIVEGGAVAIMELGKRLDNDQAIQTIALRCEEAEGKLSELLKEYSTLKCNFDANIEQQVRIVESRVLEEREKIITEYEQKNKDVLAIGRLLIPYVKKYGTNFAKQVDRIRHDFDKKGISNIAMQRTTNNINRRKLQNDNNENQLE